MLGILIAIGLEQTVEYFHWRHEVEIGRKAIVAEITADNAFHVRRAAIAPCVDRILNEAEGILDDLEAGKKPKPFTIFHSGAGQLLSMSEWDSERASQALTHFPREELALMGQYYAQVPQFSAWMDQESADMSDLSALRHPPAGLGASDIARLRSALDRARRLEFLILANGTRNLKLSDRLGLARPRPDKIRINGFCNTQNDKILNAMLLRVEKQN